MPTLYDGQLQYTSASHISVMQFISSGMMQQLEFPIISYCVWVPKTMCGNLQEINDCTDQHFSNTYFLLHVPKSVEKLEISNPSLPSQQFFLLAFKSSYNTLKEYLMDGIVDALLQFKKNSIVKKVCWQYQQKVKANNQSYY